MVVALLDLDTLALLFVTASADESPAAANNAAEGEQTEEHDTGNGTNDDYSNGTGAETTATRASIIVTDRLAVLIEPCDDPLNHGKCRRVGAQRPAKLDLGRTRHAPVAAALDDGGDTVCSPL